MADRFVVLTGCSGSGKSTLLDALSATGHAVVPEAGRQIVREELANGGTALPWMDMPAFAIRTARLAIAQREARVGSGLQVFDRSEIDVAAHLALHGVTLPDFLWDAISRHRYDETVIVSPPWRAIYADDGERGKDFATAAAEYEGLIETYRSLGYRLVVLPRAGIATRVAFVEEVLALA